MDPKPIVVTPPKFYKKEKNEVEKVEQENKTVQIVTPIKKYLPIPNYMIGIGFFLRPDIEHLNSFFLHYYFKEKFFLGGRILSFSHTEKINKIPCRESDTRYGIMFGIGKIYQDIKKQILISDKASIQEERVLGKSPDFTQMGWSAILGVSISSQTSNFDEIHIYLKKNRPKQITFSLEASYLHFFLENFSINYVFGLEKDPNTYFLLMGIQLGSWM